LFRLHHKTILVTEYTVEANDTLVGLLLAEVAYGYGIVPLLYQSANQPSLLFPSDDILLKKGDRLVVLATIEGLRKIEVRALQPKTWRVQVERVLNQDSAFEGANIVSRISGCTLKQARELMATVPQILGTPLYRPQAQRLIRTLRKTQVSASLLTTQGAKLND
ncbi:MAG: TrkA C-terminal domain-containing protein, partial [Microcystaceae cyanobacterium]